MVSTNICPYRVPDEVRGALPCKHAVLLKGQASQGAAETGDSGSSPVAGETSISK